MKRINSAALIAVLIVLFLSSFASAQVVEPIYRLNISPVMGAAGTGLIRGFFSHERYEYTPSNTLDTTIITAQGELSMKLIEPVGVGFIVPYRFIENINVLTGGTGSTGNDENGLDNIELGVNVLLPPPSETFDLAIGANVKFPTADEDINKKISSFEPYFILLTRDGDLSFTLSAGYELIIDEQDVPNLPDNMFDDILTLNVSAIFSASDVFGVGAQVLVTSAKDTLVEFIPQVRVSTETLEWGIAISVPVSNDYPQGGSLEKSFGIIFDAGIKF